MYCRISPSMQWWQEIRKFIHPFGYSPERPILVNQFMMHAAQLVSYVKQTNSQVVFVLASKAALFGWYLFVFFSPFSTAGSNLSLSLILIASVMVLPSFWQNARNEPVFWLALGLTAYILLRSLLALQTNPQINEAQNPHWTHLLRVTGLLALLLGWWLYRYPRHLPTILATALAGLIIGAIYNGSWEQIQKTGFSWRYVWGYPPGYLGMVSGAAMFGLLSWLLLPTRPVKSLKAWLIGAPLLIITAFFLYTSQSRSAWVALPIGLLALTGGLLKHSPPWRRAWPTIMTLLIALTLIIGFVFIFDGGRILVSRFSQEWATITTILSGDLKSAAATVDSTGLRLEMWLIGLNAFVEKPLFGWGPSAGIIVLNDKFTGLQFTHFHNLYLEFLVSLGIVGFGLTAITILFFLRAARQADQQKSLPPALSTGLIAATSFIAVMLLFEIRVGQTEGRAALTLITALYGMAAFQVTNVKTASQAISNKQ